MASIFWMLVTWCLWFLPDILPPTVPEEPCGTQEFHLQTKTPIVFFFCFFLRSSAALPFHVSHVICLDLWPPVLHMAQASRSRCCSPSTPRLCSTSTCAPAGPTRASSGWRRRRRRWWGTLRNPEEPRAESSCLAWCSSWALCVSVCVRMCWCWLKPAAWTPGSSARPAWWVSGLLLCGFYSKSFLDLGGNVKDQSGAC